MSIYENISIAQLLKRPIRIIENGVYAFLSRERTGKPFKIKFESSTICNLKCSMCPLTKGIKRSKGVLRFENFKKVYDEIRVPYLNLTGLGEPLFNPDLFKIIQYARKHGSLVKLDTNATILDEVRIKKLIDSDPTFISVSIDGITKKSYESIRVGAKFEQVIENLKKLIEYRNKKKSKTEIHLFFVLQKENVKDLIKFIQFGESVGIDVINGTIAMDFGDVKNKLKREMKKEDLESLRKDLIRIKKQVKLRLNLEGIEDYLKNPNSSSTRVGDKPCFYPWYNPCVTWDGWLVPCDVHCDNEVVLGNVFREPFMKLWNNKKARTFRKQLIKKRVGVCENCFVDESFIYNKFKPFYKVPILKWLSKRK